MPNEWEIGTDIHLALKNLYLKKDSYSNIDNLKRDLFYELDNIDKNSELEKYLIDIQKRKLEKFCENEIERFKKGNRVLYCEKNLEIPFKGLTLVGVIDRVDIYNNKLSIIDYKTGKYTTYNKNNFQDAVDFQLEFYYKLASGLGNVEDCFYYDLTNSTLVNEPFFNEKLKILEAHLTRLLEIDIIDFTKCEDTKPCEYCEFNIICQRK
jgi:RecB family exonuclease